MPHYIQEPAEPHPERGGPWFPHVIDQQVTDDGWVYVTWALPELRRAIVRVPYSVWLAGGHHALRDAVATLGATPPQVPDQPDKSIEDVSDQRE